MAEIAEEQTVHIRPVPRRVMIRCPKTEAAVETGYGPKAATNLQGAQVLSRCPECAADHTWRIADAFLEP